MKKLVYTLMFIVGFTTLSLAQEATQIAITEGAKELENSKVDGDYVFVFSDKTSADIEAAAKYYKHYFTVSFDETSQNAQLTMLENDKRARSVIMRFLVASGVRYASVDGEIISVNDFMMGYLQ